LENITWLVVTTKFRGTRQCGNGRMHECNEKLDISWIEMSDDSKKGSNYRHEVTGKGCQVNT